MICLPKCMMCMCMCLREPGVVHSFSVAVTGPRLVGVATYVVELAAAMADLCCVVVTRDSAKPQIACYRAIVAAGTVAQSQDT